jgi:hypothetical protein
VKGFLQIFGLDHDETFSPVCQLVSVRIILVLALAYRLTVHHLDVKTAFLNSPLSYEIWIELPQGFVSECGHRFAKLKKSLYGLKQASRDWYLLQDDFIRKFDSRFLRSKVEPCLYYIVTATLTCFILVHVDDYVIACSDPAFYEAFYQAFSARFQITDLGVLSHILQLRVDWGVNSVSLSQTRAIDDLVVQYGLLDAKPRHTPIDPKLQLAKAATCDLTLPYLSLIGSLLWICRCTRPDIAYAVCYLSGYSHAYSSAHFNALKRIVVYLRTTREYRLTYTVPIARCISTPLNVVIYCDSDWASDEVDRKSFTGIGAWLDGCLIAWICRKQATVATSSTEAEYMAMSDSGKEGMYIRNLMSEFAPVATPMIIHYDNQGAGYLSENPVNNRRSRHIDIRYHCIRDWVAARLFHLEYTPTAQNTADLWTKALEEEPFRRHTAACLDVTPLARP